MLQVNEANGGYNKMKWSSLPSEWKNKWIKLTMKTKKKKKINRNAFANNESWMTNDEGWITNDEWWRMNGKWWLMNDKR